MHGRFDTVFPGENPHASRSNLNGILGLTEPGDAVSSVFSVFWGKRKRRGNSFGGSHTWDGWNAGVLEFVLTRRPRVDLDRTETKERLKDRLKGRGSEGVTGVGVGVVIVG